MALNMTRKYTSDRTEKWPVSQPTGSGVAILSSTDQPGVTLAGSGDFTFTEEVGPYTISGPAGGVGVAPGKVIVATDGGFHFPVAGVTAATPVNTPVFIEPDGDLTLTEGSNKLFGKIDRVIGESSPTQASVWIGTTFNPAGA